MSDLLSKYATTSEGEIEDVDVTLSKDSRLTCLHAEFGDETVLVAGDSSTGLVHLYWESDGDLKRLRLSSNTLGVIQRLTQEPFV